MANKYWVGGAGTWNTTLTTNWRTTSGGSTVAAVPTAADSVFFDANSGGTFAVTMTGALACLDITVSTGGVVTFNTGTTPTLSVASNMAIDGGTVWNSTGTITFTATTAKTVSTSGAVFSCPITFNGTGGSWQLATSLTCSSTTTLTAGTLNLNGFTLTTANFASASAVARTIAFGTGNITCNGSGTVWNTGTVTGLTVTGTPTVNINNNSATASTVASGACTEAQSFNFNFTTGTYALTFLATAAHTARSVDFTGYNGTWAATSTTTIYGSLTFPTSAASASFATTTSVSAMTFGGTSGSKTINCNSRTINFPIIFNGVGSSWQYTSNMLVNGTITLTNGTIDVNSQTNGLYGISGITMITGTVTLLNCPSAFTLTHTSGTLNIGSAGTGACTLGAYTFTAGSLTLNANLTLQSTGLTWTAGTLTLNSYTLYSPAFVANGATIRAIAFGTGNITITGAGTCWNQTTIGTFTFTGTSDVRITNSGTTATTVITGVATETNALNFNFSGGAYALTFLGTATHTARNVVFNDSWTGTWNATSTCTIWGSLYLGAAMTLSSSASVLTLGGVTSLSKTITSNSKTILSPLTFSGTGSTWVLQDAMFVGTLLTTTLTSGVLNLNDYNLITGIFSSSGAVARTIAFGSAGTNKISCIYNGGAAASTTTLFTTATATLLTVTGTYPLVQVVSDTATSLTYVVASGPSSLGAEANAFNFYFQGSFNLTFLGTAGYVCKDVDFGYSGSLSGTWNATSTGTIYGNVILGPNMALTTSASAMTLGGTSGTKTFKSNGKGIPFPIILNAPGSTRQLTDAFSLSTAALLFTHTAGTLDLNGVTCTVGTYATGVGTKSLIFNGGSLYISGSGVTAFNNANPLNYTVGPGGSYGYIYMSSATAKTFVGGGSTYDCYLLNSGTGALTISGASTYASLVLGYTVLITGSNNFRSISSSGLNPRVLTLTAGTTQTFTVLGNFAPDGSAGDLTTINSSVAGTVANIARNYAVNDANYGGHTDYVSLKDINFTPSTTDHTGGLPNIWWAGSHSITLGNNYGVTFTDWSGLATTSIKAYYISNTSTTSWTTPADWNPDNNIIHMIGGGGGGSGSRWTSTTNRAGGGGGGGGGYTKITNYSSVAGTPTSITIGTAGTAGAAGGSGGAGGTTIFGAYNAGGGSPGTIGSTNSTGGTGGVGTTYNGGAGGTGTYSATLAAGSGGGGGGGAAGPLGNGGAGGASFATTTTASVSGGGGGGNGGGSAGTAGASAVSGKGGNNNAGTGGGATNGAAGTNGGGGASNVSTGAGAVGGFGIDILNTWGGGGGTGGPAQLAATNSLTTAYGAGGAGGGVTTAATVAAQLAGGNGGGGLIVIQYYPLILSPGTPGVGSGFFAFF
jgi:hypothetical protein